MMLAALTRINCICTSPNHRSIFLFKSKLLKLSCPSDLLFPILSTLVTPMKLFAFSTLPLVFFVLLMSQTHISTPLRLITHSTLPALLCTICYLGGLTPGIYHLPSLPPCLFSFPPVSMSFTHVFCLFNVYMYISVYFSVYLLSLQIRVSSANILVKTRSTQY